MQRLQICNAAADLDIINAQFFSINLFDKQKTVIRCGRKRGDRAITFAANIRLTKTKIHIFERIQLILGFRRRKKKNVFAEWQNNKVEIYRIKEHLFGIARFTR